MDSYEPNESIGFWTKRGDRPTLVGDFLGRIPAVDLLAPKAGEGILDAGCGAGFTSRMIAKFGAKVTGVDKSDDMITAAQNHEREQPLGIHFSKGDVSSYIDSSAEKFDAVSCIAVLMYVQSGGCQKFFEETFRVLRPGGRLVISITHPELYLQTVNFKTEDEEWVRHEVVGEPDINGSQLYREYYRNNEGKLFKSDLYSHSLKFLRGSIISVGFEISKEQTTFVTREGLTAGGQRKGQTNYPAFFQVLAKKI